MLESVADRVGSLSCDITMFSLMKSFVTFPPAAVCPFFWVSNQLFSPDFVGAESETPTAALHSHCLALIFKFLSARLHFFPISLGLH